jgi:predicted nucleotidyltransferase component of viral defense system
MLSRYKCHSANDYQNALKEIIQEVALLGLWRAKFFEHAAFYGGTALRILYGLDRFSEDLDFSLMRTKSDFRLNQYLAAIESELNGFGFKVSVTEKMKTAQSVVESAFIKAGTKEHMLKISVPQAIIEQTQTNAVLNVKLEIDTNPPDGFEVEAKTLLQPIPFSVKTYTLPDLFAGKLHAILQRSWQGRVKGRDYYDFVWYVARQVPVRLSHLEQRMRQSGAWSGAASMKRDDLTTLLLRKFAAVDTAAAKRDVQPFLRDSATVALWSQEFFESLLPRLQVI